MGAHMWSVCKVEKAFHLIASHLIAFYVTLIQTDILKTSWLSIEHTTFCIHFCCSNNISEVRRPVTQIHIVQHPFKWNLLWANHILFFISLTRSISLSVFTQRPEYKREIWYQEVAQWNGTDDANSVPHFRYIFHIGLQRWMWMCAHEKTVCTQAIPNTLLYMKGSVAFWQKTPKNDLDRQFFWCWKLYDSGKKITCKKIWGSSAR